MKITKYLIHVSLLLTLIFVFAMCSKRISSSYGKLAKTYSCIGVLPLNNETSFEPMDKLLAGYLNLEFYNQRYDEVMASDDFFKIYSEEGGVYFPKRFNKPSALEYSKLLGLDGIIYGSLSSPERFEADSSGREKLLNIEIYFVDVKNSNVAWSYNERTFIEPGNYNKDMKNISKKIVKALGKSGFNYVRSGNPCWDTKTAGTLRNLPPITRENFNSLSMELSESNDENLRLNLGNIFMLLGRRNLALSEYQKFLARNPASPFRGEVERQVAVIRKGAF